MFTFRYIGHFDLNDPVDDYNIAVPNVAKTLERDKFESLVDRFQVDRDSFPGSLEGAGVSTTGPSSESGSVKHRF